MNSENNFIAIEHSKEDCKEKRLYYCGELLEAQELCEWQQAANWTHTSSVLQQ